LRVLLPQTEQGINRGVTGTVFLAPNSLHAGFQSAAADQNRASSQVNREIYREFAALETLFVVPHDPKVLV